MRLTGDIIVNTERIDKLEIRMSYLENFLNQLNDIVLENGRKITDLKRDQLNLKNHINEITNELPGPESEKPPHY
jgi:SlyX protein